MESRKAAYEEMRLQTTAENRQRGCRRDVRRVVYGQPRLNPKDWRTQILGRGLPINAHFDLERPNSVW